MDEIDGEDSALFGRVVDETGRPIRGASVAIVAGPGPTPDLAAVSDEDGWFAFGDFDRGRWTIRAYAEDGRTGENEIAVGGPCLIIVRRRRPDADAQFRPVTDDLDDFAPKPSARRDWRPPETWELSTPESD